VIRFALHQFKVRKAMTRKPLCVVFAAVGSWDIAYVNPHVL
jgi:hypothetical protein